MIFGDKYLVVIANGYQSSIKHPMHRA